MKYTYADMQKLKAKAKEKAGKDVKKIDSIFKELKDEFFNGKPALEPKKTANKK